MSAALDASYQFCARLSRREAKNFYWSFRLLPDDRRRSMCALYAFMRHTDDIADEDGTAGAKREALGAWRRELESALVGGPSKWPGLLALADAVEKHRIPRKYLHEVIDGCESDLEPKVYETFDDLYGYCYRVASAVGLCCIHIWGFDSDHGRAERLAEWCGVALQLTNVLRDVREDALKGRVYLPREDLERFGVRPEDLSAGPMNDRLRGLFAFQARRAYDDYERAAPLVGLVDPVGRPVLRALVGIYRALLDEIARRDYDVLSARVSLPPWRKAAIALSAWLGMSGAKPVPSPERPDAREIAV